MVDAAIDAYQILKKKEISTRIIDMHTIKPLDEKLILKSAKDTGTLVTVEEHSIIGGLGGAVAECLAEKHSKKPYTFSRMGIHDRFCESGEPADLMEKYKLNAKHIAAKIEQQLSC